MKHILMATSALAASLSLSSAGVANAEEGTVINTGSGVELKISGQLNRGVLVVDDGAQTETYFVDNDNASSRINFGASADLGGLKVGSTIEVEIESNSTATVNQLSDDNGSITFQQRKLEVFVEGGFGKLWLGHGDTASNGTSEVDLSGTSVVAYSSVSDLAGGSLLRGTGGALSASSLGDAFSNFDGQSRRDRLRYDTPTFGGFGLSASVAEGDRGDIALTYDKTFGAFQFASAVAYSEQNDNERVNGSASILHDSGFSLTLAAGEDRPEVGNSAEFGYAKVGYKTDSLSSWGETAVSLDIYEGSDVLSAGVDSTSYGIALVQNIDKINTQVYAGVRTYEVDGFQDSNALLFGARVRF